MKLGVSLYIPNCFVFSRVHVTLQPALSVRRSVGPSVCRSVTLYFFGVFGVFGRAAPAKCSTDLNHCPCPPARD